jgi:hypothetical protein
LYGRIILTDDIGQKADLHDDCRLTAAHNVVDLFDKFPGLLKP